MPLAAQSPAGPAGGMQSRTRRYECRHHSRPTVVAGVNIRQGASGSRRLLCLALCSNTLVTCDRMTGAGCGYASGSGDRSRLGLDSCCPSAARGVFGAPDTYPGVWPGALREDALSGQTARCCTTMRARGRAMVGGVAYTARNLRPWRLVARAPRSGGARRRASSLGGWAAGRAVGTVVAMAGDYRSRVRVPTAALSAGR
jgi:hypothetical protein